MRLGASGENQYQSVTSAHQNPHAEAERRNNTGLAPVEVFKSAKQLAQELSENKANTAMLKENLQMEIDVMESQLEGLGENERSVLQARIDEIRKRIENL